MSLTKRPFIAHDQYFQIDLLKLCFHISNYLVKLSTLVSLVNELFSNFVSHESRKFLTVYNT